MLTYIKSQASSIIATLFDFLTTIVCKEIFNFAVVFSSFLGTIVGGVVNFSLGRNWVFNKREKKIPLQIIKYILVWCGNLLLTTLGVFVANQYIGLNYIVSKIVVAVIMGLTYNYFLQKKFVFA
jgi:putative flippase GtrA